MGSTMQLKKSDDATQPVATMAGPLESRVPALFPQTGQRMGNVIERPPASCSAHALSCRRGSAIRALHKAVEALGLVLHRAS